MSNNCESDKRNHRYELRISYEMAGSKFPKFKKDKDVETVLGVDLGFKAGILGYSISEMKAHKK